MTHVLSNFLTLLLQCKRQRGFLWCDTGAFLALLSAGGQDICRTWLDPFFSRMSIDSPCQLMSPKFITVHSHAQGICGTRCLLDTRTKDQTHCGKCPPTPQILWLFPEGKMCTTALASLCAPIIPMETMVGGLTYARFAQVGARL